MTTGSSNTDDEFTQRGHVITAFEGDYEDVAGKVLKLDHIDVNFRPLDELFRDHFFQCVLKHMRGAAEST